MGWKNNVPWKFHCTADEVTIMHKMSLTKRYIVWDYDAFIRSNPVWTIQDFRLVMHIYGIVLTFIFFFLLWESPKLNNACSDWYIMCSLQTAINHINNILLLHFWECNTLFRASASSSDVPYVISEIDPHLQSYRSVKRTLLCSTLEEVSLRPVKPHQYSLLCSSLTVLYVHAMTYFLLIVIQFTSR